MRASRLRVSKELRLLMSLARAQHRSEVLNVAERLLASGPNWERLGALARRNRVLGLLQNAFEKHFPKSMPESFALQLKRDAAGARMLGMALLSTQLGVIDRVLRPLDARFVSLKGAALSKRWYGDPLIRQVSDVDLLVEEGAIVAVVARLVAQGWRIANPHWKGQQLDMFVRYTGVVELDVPDGRRIEIHRLIDGTGIVFDPKALLSETSTLKVAGREVPVLGVGQEIQTAIFHHARHGWSCYHWVADLVSMMDSLGSSNAQMLAACRHPLLGPTVVGAVELARDIERIVLDGEVSSATPHSPFLAPCIESVDRTNPLQRSDIEPDPTQMEPDFPAPWQRTIRYRALFQLTRLRPSLTDLDWWPLPARLAWLYWLARPARLGLNMLQYKEKPR